MRELQWKDEYLLGIPAVDLQHRRIFDRFITIAGGSTKHDSLLAESAMVQLVGLLDEHFSLEERMMRALCYPGLDRHVEEHRQFRFKVSEFARETLRFKKSASLDAIKVAQQWLQQHILVSDRHYVDFFSGLTV